MAVSKWKRYAQELESGQEERLARSQILKERDQARAERDELRVELRALLTGEDKEGLSLLGPAARAREAFDDPNPAEEKMAEGPRRVEEGATRVWARTSSEGKLIGVCAKGEQYWWPADSEQDKCPDPDCDCEPTFYLPASEVERLRTAIHSYLTWCEQHGWKPGDVDGLHAALADEKEAS